MSRFRVAFICGVIALASVAAATQAPKLLMPEIAMSAALGDGSATGANPPVPSSPSGTVRRVWAGKGIDPLEGHPSPDGRLYAFTDWDVTKILPSGEKIGCGIAVRDLGRGTTVELERTMTKNCDSEVYSGPFSPDGRQLAYEMDWGGPVGDWGESLGVVGLDSSPPRVLATATRAVLVPQDWTPDGKQLLYVVGRENQPPQLAMVPVGGGAPRNLKTFRDWRDPDGVRMRISPDGRFIAYSYSSIENDGRQDVSMLSMEDGRDMVIFRHVAKEYVVGWSADGTHLLLASDRAASPGLWSLEISNGKPVGHPVLIRGDVWRMDGIRVTASGDYFYVVHSGDRDIFSANIDISTGKLLSKPSGITRHPGLLHGSPVWSLDGKYLAYHTSGIPIGGVGSTVVTIRSLEGGEVREFRPKVSYVQWITPGPGAQALTLRAKDAKGRDGLLRLDLKTGEVTPLLQPLGEFRWGPLFSPDGRWMYYVSSESKNFFLKKTDSTHLVARDLSTGAERELYTSSAGFVVQLGIVSQVQNSNSDAGSVIVRIMDSDRGEKITEARLLRVPVDGAPARELFAPAHGDSLLTGRVLGLSGDQRSVLFVRVDRRPKVWIRSIWRVPLTGGAAQLIGVGPEGLPNMELSPDGRHVAFLQGAAEQELWVLKDSALTGRPVKAAAAPRK